MTLNGAIKQLHDLRNSDAMPVYFKPAIAEAINVLLSDVRENVRGEWIPHDLENGEKSIDRDCCSVCGERFREIAMTGCEWNFCPNCGAKMGGDKS